MSSEHFLWRNATQESGQNLGFQKLFYICVANMHWVSHSVRDTWCHGAPFEFLPAFVEFLVLGPNRGGSSSLRDLVLVTQLQPQSLPQKQNKGILLPPVISFFFFFLILKYQSYWDILSFNKIQSYFLWWLLTNGYRSVTTTTRMI